MNEYRLTMDAKGRVILPLPVRSAVGMKGGGNLIAKVENDGSIRLESVAAVIARMQDECAKYAIPGVLASEELIADRRREAARE